MGSFVKKNILQKQLLQQKYCSKLFLKNFFNFIQKPCFRTLPNVIFSKYPVNNYVKTCRSLGQIFCEFCSFVYLFATYTVPKTAACAVLTWRGNGESRFVFMWFLLATTRFPEGVGWFKWFAVWMDTCRPKFWIILQLRKLEVCQFDSL